MKTPALLSSALLAVVLSGPPVFAQDAGQLSPAPAVVDHVVHLARLPAPAELLKGAEAQHATIERIDQTSSQVVVTYNYSNGRKITFAYTLLSAAAAAVPGLNPSSVQPVVAAPPPPAPVATVVYAPPPPVYYYYPREVRYYDPAWDCVTPLAVGVSFGWIWHNGYGHGHVWHGGHHGGWRRY